MRVLESVSGTLLHPRAGSASEIATDFNNAFILFGNIVHKYKLSCS